MEHWKQCIAQLSQGEPAGLRVACFPQGIVHRQHTNPSWMMSFSDHDPQRGTIAAADPAPRAYHPVGSAEP